MDSTKEPTSVPEFTFPDDGGRVLSTRSSHPPEFRLGDQVKLYDSELDEWTGPYLVSYVDNRRYKLCNDQQEEVNGGQWVEEAALRLFDPFEEIPEAPASVV
ncbi:hypothetical protein J3E68DRAFT_399173 [Trichoderma sp. SZMC 28012]